MKVLILPIILSLCEASLSDMYRRMAVIARDQWSNLNLLHHSMSGFREQLWRKEIDGLESVHSVVTSFVNNPDWVHALKFTETASLCVVMNRMTLLNKQVEIMDMIVALIANEVSMSPESLELREIQDRFSEILVISHNDMHVKLALRNLAYDRRQHLMQFRVCFEAFNFKLKEAAFFLRYSVDSLPHRTPELEQLISDSGWDDEPSTEESLDRLESLIVRHAKFLRGRSIRLLGGLIFARRVLSDIRFMVSMWNLYATRSELCHFREEAKLLQLYLPKSSEDDDETCQFMREDFRLLEALI